jgi:hypothetical protein
MIPNSVSIGSSLRRLARLNAADGEAESISIVYGLPGRTTVSVRWKEYLAELEGSASLSF